MQAALRLVGHRDHRLHGYGAYGCILRQIQLGIARLHVP
jgi:hypothetical protein